MGGLLTVGVTVSEEVLLLSLPVVRFEEESYVGEPEHTTTDTSLGKGPGGLLRLKLSPLG